MPGDISWRSQKTLLTAGTHDIADGEVGDEKRELREVEQCCVVMKSLWMWKEEKSIEREG